MNRIDLAEVWRDAGLLADIRAEVKRQAQTKWRPWEVLLPPELIWPMIEEVSQGMATAWSPTIDGIGIRVGAEHEVSIRFVLPDINPSPVKTQTLPYDPSKATVPIEVRNGTPLRV